MDIKFMDHAISLAKTAAAKGEVPVGAVVVCDGEIIGEGYNRCEELSSPIAHAEILAIEAAAKTRQDKRLSGCSLYVTLEPCPMCAGAIVNSRIERVVYGAYDEKAGAFGTMLNLTEYPLFKPTVEGGVLKEECSSILSEFFKKKRAK